MNTSDGPGEGISRASALLRPARCHPLRVSALLREVWGPWGIAETALLVATGQVKQLFDRTCVIVDVRGRVALLPYALRHRVEAELGRVDVGDLVPLERTADSRVRHGPHRVPRGDRPIARVLVVIDEDPVALLLPPLAGGVPRQAPLDLARQRQRRPSHLDVVPA